jgi:hypothetical protein
MLRFLLLLLCIAACERRNPDVCCETDTECGRLGFDSTQPCELGVCVANVCQSDGCDGDEDCAAPAQFCVAGACVACRDAQGCSPQAPVCDDGTHTCRPCIADDECASGVCDVPTGTCADDSAIRFASPGGGSSDPCTRPAPCSVAQALQTIDTQHPYVLMTAGTYRAGGTLQGGAATIIGQDATLNVLDADGEIQVVGQSILSIRHLAVNGGTSAVEGVSCRESSTVNIADVTFAGRGVTGSGCQNMSVMSAVFTDASIGFNDGGLVSAGLVVDRSRFVRGGISVVGGSFFARVTNSSIVAAPNGVAMQLLSVTNGLPSVQTIIAFNTIDGGVVQCGDTAMPNASTHRYFTGNIVVNLDVPLDKKQSCHYDYNDVLPPDFALGGFGNINADPKFVDAVGGDYHLQLGSPALDAADPTATNDHDLDGVARPQNGRADMGAFERTP